MDSIATQIGYYYTRTRYLPRPGVADGLPQRDYVGVSDPLQNGHLALEAALEVLLPPPLTRAGNYLSAGDACMFMVSVRFVS